MVWSIMKARMKIPLFSGEYTYGWATRTKRYFQIEVDQKGGKQLQRGANSELVLTVELQHPQGHMGQHSRLLKLGCFNHP